MNKLSDIEKINLYNKCITLPTITLNDGYQREIYSIVNHYHDSMLWHMYGKEIDDDSKKDFIDKLYNLASRIIINNSTADFHIANFCLINANLDPNLILDYLSLVYFPNECFNNYNKEMEEKYLFIIESLLISNDYYVAECLKNHSLFNYIYSYLNYSLNNKNEYNIFIPHIILYCIKNNASIEEFNNILVYSYKNYDELVNFINLNNYHENEDELCNMAIEKIVHSQNKLIK